MLLPRFWVFKVEIHNSEGDVVHTEYSSRMAKGDIRNVKEDIASRLLNENLLRALRKKGYSTDKENLNVSVTLKRT